MVTQPSGTVTLLFSDIEGSTRLLERLGTESYAGVLEQHRRLLREAFAQHDGYEVDTEGDSFFVSFTRAADALAAAAEAQTAIAAAAWPRDSEVRVRMGLHTGTPALVEGNYVGPDVHKAARIMSAGHGGQVLLSQATAGLVDTSELRDLGAHRLKDFDEPVRLFQLGAAVFSPLKTLTNTNLPVAASSFVGREREVADVTALLRNGGGRLVTLTGPGGSGKTRLAVEAAADVVGEYPDGVSWIGLASLREPSLVVETIAQTLGASDGLAERVGDRTLLLLLDNFEHLIDAAVDLSALLGACRNLRLLVTSRELLRLQGEVEYQVPPLAQSEAEELFSARSRLPRDDEIADLCRHLDDLPLAVELAAARTAVLSPAQIRDRLSQRLDLFKGSRDADPRQQTLRATIEWSYELLSEPEKQLFARLAVFAGGCTFEAAEEIVGADVDVLQSLVDKSLVRRSGGRFWMLETIGELARERLNASAEARETGRRHADWFLALAERAEPALKGAEQGHWLKRLEDDHNNLRAGLEWFFDHGEGESALRLAGALWLFWYMHGHVSEARRWLGQALDTAPDVPSEARSKVLDGAGYLAHEQGDEEEGIGLLEASFASAKEVEAMSAAAIAAAHLCGVRGRLSDPQSGLAVGEEAVALAREAGDDYVLAVALNNLGSAFSALGDNDRATPYLEESLELRRRLGDSSRIALSLVNLGWMALLRGETSRSAAMYAEAGEIATALGDKRHICYAVGGLAWVACVERCWDEADAYIRESLRVGQEIGKKSNAVEAIYCLAGIAAATGDPARAARLAAAADLHWSFVEDIHVLRIHQGNIESTKAACDPEIWERAWQEGRAMSLDEAAEYALSLA